MKCIHNNVPNDVGLNSNNGPNFYKKKRTHLFKSLMFIFVYRLFKLFSKLFPFTKFKYLLISFFFLNLDFSKIDNGNNKWGYQEGKRNDLCPEIG